MNANRLIRLAINLLLRYSAKGRSTKRDPNARRAQQALKISRRIGRL